MQRRTLLSATLGLGALASLTSFADDSALADLPLTSGSELAFGTTVSIKVLHPDQSFALAAIKDALHQVKQVDALMSVYQAHSQVFQLNLHGLVDSPDPHLLRVLAFAQQLSVMTAGAFDMTVQPLWTTFTQARAKNSLPIAQDIAAAKALVNWRHVEISPQRVRFKKPGMALTLNGLAQGYAVDLALQALTSRGIVHALLDTGEFAAIGNKAQRRPWVLGIGDPRHSDAVLAKLALDGRKVATSGDYEIFFSPDFVHHHIFDPATGDSPTELASVTVVAPTGVLADGLSTAFMVMGADRALALTAKWHDVDTLLIHKNGAIQQSHNFPQWQA